MTLQDAISHATKTLANSNYSSFSEVTDGRERAHIMQYAARLMAEEREKAIRMARSDGYREGRTDGTEHRPISPWMALVLLIAMSFVFYIGCLVGQGTATHNEKIRSLKGKCTGYTVLDADHVITCQGDTVAYDWQNLWHPAPLEKSGTGSDISEP